MTERGRRACALLTCASGRLGVRALEAVGPARAPTRAGFVERTGIGPDRHLGPVPASPGAPTRRSKRSVRGSRPGSRGPTKPAVDGRRGGGSNLPLQMLGYPDSLASPVQGPAWKPHALRAKSKRAVGRRCAAPAGAAPAGLPPQGIPSSPSAAGIPSAGSKARLPAQNRPVARSRHRTVGERDPEPPGPTALETEPRARALAVDTPSPPSPRVHERRSERPHPRRSDSPGERERMPGERRSQRTTGSSEADDPGP